MKQWLKDLFSDGSTVSSMRVMSMLCVLTACGISVYSVSHNQSDASIITVLLTAGISGKVIQKKIEGSNG